MYRQTPACHLVSREAGKQEKGFHCGFFGVRGILDHGLQIHEGFIYDLLLVFNLSLNLQAHCLRLVCIGYTDLRNHLNFS